MKKKEKKNVWRGLLLTAALLVSGCGASTKEAAYDSAAVAVNSSSAQAAEYATDDIYTAETSMEVPMEASADAGEGKVLAEEGEEGASGSTEATVQDSSRKRIRNVSLEVETENFDTLLENISARTEKLGGYVEASYTYNGSWYLGESGRNANFTLRIPAQRLDDFLSQVAEISNIISQNETVTDITLQYVDRQSRREALETEQARLLELMEQAESVEDMIAIESRLSEVRYQLESTASQLRTMENQVSYSTVHLYINEVARLTPVKEQPVLEKISTGFSESLYNVTHGISDFFISLVIHLPYLAVWAVSLVLVLLAVRLVVRRRRKRREKASEEKKDTKQERDDAK